MWKKLSLVMLVVVIASLSFAAIASADSVNGNGWLQAEGDGKACMTGDATTLTVSGNGVLWYFDDGEVDTPVITGEGFRRELSNGWVRWEGFDGTFNLEEADQIIVCLHGENINLYVEGQGAVKLTGRGSYETGSGDQPTLRGRWSHRGKVIRMGS